MSDERRTVGRATGGAAVDPDWMFRVPDCGAATLNTLIALLRATAISEQWLYREAELDDLWRHAEMEMRAAREAGAPASVVGAYSHLHEVAYTAHNLAAAGRLTEAAEQLASARDQLLKVVGSDVAERGP